MNRRCMQCSTCVNPRLKKRCLGREEGFIEDEPEPARNEEDENSPEKLLEEVERDLNTVVFPQENTVMLPQEYAARAAHIARLQRSLAIRVAETASRSMPPPVKLRHSVRPPFVNNEEEPPRHEAGPARRHDAAVRVGRRRARARTRGATGPGAARRGPLGRQPPSPAWTSATGRVISDVFAGGRPSSWLVRLLASYMATDKLGRQRMCVIIAALEEQQHNFAERLIHDLNLEAQPSKSGDPIVAAWTYRLLQYAYVKQGEREGDALKAGEIAEKMEREIRAAQEQHSWNNITGHGGELPVGGWRTSDGSRSTAIATAGSAGAVGIVFDLIMSGILGKRPTKEDWARISHTAHAIAMQHPNDALVLQLYGGLLWRRGEMRAASMVLMKAYQHDGQQARAAPWAFETLLLMGDKEGATAMFEGECTGSTRLCRFG